MWDFKKTCREKRVILRAKVSQYLRKALTIKFTRRTKLAQKKKKPSKGKLIEVLYSRVLKVYYFIALIFSRGCQSYLLWRSNYRTYRPKKWKWNFYSVNWLHYITKIFEKQLQTNLALLADYRQIRGDLYVRWPEFLNSRENIMIASWPVIISYN